MGTISVCEESEGVTIVERSHHIAKRFCSAYRQNHGVDIRVICEEPGRSIDSSIKRVCYSELVTRVVVEQMTSKTMNPLG